MRTGSKYDPLRDHLSQSRRETLSLSIVDIEEILGFELCRSASAPSWWANTTSDVGRAQRRAWRSAGYDAFLSADGETVEFKAIADAPESPSLSRMRDKSLPRT